VQNEAMKRMTPFEVTKAVPFFLLDILSHLNTTLFKKALPRRQTTLPNLLHVFSLAESSAVHHLNGWLVWLKGYKGQAFAADFVVGGPLYAGFYLSRFW
jgi:hypothetical protein